MFSRLTPIVKNLIIINGLFFLATIAFKQYGISLVNVLGLHYFESPLFTPIQIVTHFFMHSDQSMYHIFSNMFALFMFGPLLEKVWGSKRFAQYYFFTAIGAALLHTVVNAWQFNDMEKNMLVFEQNPSAVVVEQFGEQHAPRRTQLAFAQLRDALSDHPTDRGLQQQAAGYMQQVYNLKLNIPTVGASGAVFGILLAFGMLFPNTPLMLLFLPFPIKAKYFVMLYGGFELFRGLQFSPDSGVAHFAHLGGMLFGFLLIKAWDKQRDTFY